MFFYEWGFLLILESNKKGLQSFPEKGNEEGGILDASDDQKIWKFSSNSSSFSSDLLMIDKLVG